MKSNVYLGIDIGGTEVKVGLVTLQGEVLEKESYSVSFDGYMTPIMDTVVSKTTEFLKKSVLVREDKANLKGIGVSATGQINPYSGVVEGAAGHIKNWLNTPIKRILEEAFFIPVTAINDANSAALGEYWIGGAKDVSDAVIVTIGTGIGGGIICDHKILMGESGAAGEVGHFTIQCNGEACNCGNVGCYEHYASTSALVRMVKKAIKEEELEFPSAEVNGKTIFQALESGNKKLEQIYQTWLDYVAAGLITLIHIFNPKKVLIGGGISAQKQAFIEPLKEKVFEKIMTIYRKNLSFEAAQLGNDAGLVGAVCYFLEEQKEKRNN